MRALIVDDDAANRRVLELMLADRCECHHARSGAEALQMFETGLHYGQSYDLVLLDLNMPGLDGHETLSRIREIEAGRRVPDARQVKILMATSSDQQEDIGTAFVRGCQGYLVKPIDPALLLRKMQQLGLLPEPS